jgi:glyoxylase-like metal-dependent hydrolase (beta-lactamase superfamily II)
LSAALAAAAFALATAATGFGAASVKLGPPGPARPVPQVVEVDSLADSTWVLSSGSANVLGVLTPSGWVIVDTGTKAEALAVRAELMRISPRPIAFVVNTHFHDDHAGGNSLYLSSRIPVIATKATQQLQRERRARLEAGAPEEIDRLAAFAKTLPPGEDHERLAGFYEFLGDWWREGLEEAKKDPKAVAPASETFEGRAHRVVGGVPVELRAFGGPAHTGGDCVVIFPTRKVVAVGDVYARGSAPWADQFMGDGSIEGLMGAQDSLLAWIPEADSAWAIVPGHGRASNRAGLEQNRTAIAELRACALSAWKAGRKREHTAEDCAGSGFSGTQGGLLAWLFYEEWDRAAAAAGKKSPASERDATAPVKKARRGA